MPKKIVKYKPLEEPTVFRIGMSTGIIPINHTGPYAVNGRPNFTSPVTRIGRDGEFWTKNTHYVPEKA